MRVMLVNANSSADAASGKQAKLPYGALYVAAVLELNGYEVKVIDRNIDEGDIQYALDEFLPDFVGISLMTGPCITDALEISKQVKQVNPDIKVIWGGVHPTMLPDLCLSEPSVDFVVRYEGEYVIVDLLKGLADNKQELDKINGISFKKDGKIYHTPRRPYIENLDELPYPAWHLVEMDRYIQVIDGRKYITMNTSRGCPHRCAFCYNKLFNEFKYRCLSTRVLIEQINYLRTKYGISFVEFLEDNFTASRKRIEEFCDELSKDGTDIIWYCESKVGLSKDLLEKMKKAGCVGIGFGIESGSPKILKYIKKDITVSQVIETFKLCRKTGIYPDAYFMVGFPNETLKDFKMTMKLCGKISPRMTDLMVFRPYPGTELYDTCVSEGIFSPPDNLELWADISDQHSASFSVGQIPVGVIKSAKRKTLLRNQYSASMRDLRSVPIYRLPFRLLRKISRLPSFLKHIQLKNFGPPG